MNGNHLQCLVFVLGYCTVWFWMSLIGKSFPKLNTIIEDVSEQVKDGKAYSPTP